MWALQLYIVLFSKLPLTIPGAPSIHFSIRLQPRDQHPVIYITTVLGPLFILSPWGAIFSYPDQVCMCIFTLIKYMLLYSIIFRYCSRRVFGCHVCRYFVITHQHDPFRYIINTTSWFYFDCTPASPFTIHFIHRRFSHLQISLHTLPYYRNLPMGPQPSTCFLTNLRYS